MSVKKVFATPLFVAFFAIVGTLQIDDPGANF